ncbi:MAG: hypothetical protein K8F54_01825 [Altibacter sp.]|uniref:hypothetical protein n=1 Tax=Altibacter sp. TaxID=2024823 RepID=UPI001D32429C|nr:hypothetical protein [Altibacter sp.]MBZ0326319.1 hypothetical protein [Altibacter sp.]
MHKTLRTLILFCTIHLSFSILVAQEAIKPESILIYSEGDGYLQPFIESVIKGLSYKDKKGERQYFNKVNSLNTFISDNRYQSILNDIISIRKPDNVSLDISYTENQKKDNNRVFDILVDYDYFLAIKTNTLVELIEFQFQLFETRKSELKKDSINSPLNIADNIIGVENFFVNPKESNYGNQIKLAIERLFHNSNSVPQAELYIFDQLYKSEDTISLPTKAFIVLDGSSSGDTDSEIVKYLWYNIPGENEKYQTFKKLELLDNVAKQNIIINQDGFYKIGFKVNDGVSDSNQIIINIKAENRPEIPLLLDTISYSIHRQTLLKNFKPKIRQKAELYFENNGPVKLIADDFILANKKLDILEKFNPKDSIFLVETKIENYNDQGIYKIVFESQFLAPEIDSENDYFLYRKNLDGRLSQPSHIKHKLYTNGLFIIHIGVSPYTIGNNKGDNFTTESGEEIVLGRNSGFVGFGGYLSISALLTNNWELGFSGIFGKKESVFFNNYELFYPATTSFWLNYIFRTNGMNGSIEPFIGPETNSILYKDNTLLEDNFNTAWTIGGNVGVIYKLFHSGKVDSDLRLSFMYGVLSYRELSDIYVTTLKIQYSLRI